MTFMNTISSVITQPLRCIGRSLQLGTLGSRTRRGTRAGTRHIRQIRVLSGNSRQYRTYYRYQNGVNLNNIVTVTPFESDQVSSISTCVGNRPDISHPTVNHNRANALQSVNITLTDQDQTRCNIFLATLNCRSVKNKALSVCDFVTSQDIDILAITETWLGSNIDESVIQELVPTGYKILHHSRYGRRGGGIALLFKSNINIKQLPCSESNYTHFEHMEFCVGAMGLHFRMCVVYRPPPSKSNGLRNTVFFEEWESYLDQHTILSHEILIMGISISI